MKEVGTVQGAGRILADERSGLEVLSSFLQKLEQYQHFLSAAEKASPKAIGPVVVTRGSDQLEPLVTQIELLRNELVRSKGSIKPLVVNLTGKQHATAFGVTFDVWDRAFEKDPAAPLKDWALGHVADAVREAIGSLEAGQSPLKLKALLSPPKAFIAHGGTTKALDRLCEFLRALGVEPIVVEQRPSEGRSPDRQVQKHIEDADCGIIFATRGSIKDLRSGKEHPRLNVIDELARLRSRFPDRVILLLENGGDLPSNVSEVVYERFTRSNLEKAFLKVAKELRAFGIIRSGKPGR